MLLAAIVCSVSAFGANPNEISGKLGLRINDCYKPNHQGDRSTYVLENVATLQMTELDVSALDPSTLKMGKEVTAKGIFVADAHAHAHGLKKFRVTELNYVNNGTEAAGEGEAGGGESAGASSGGAPALTEMTCLLIFADTLDTTYPQSKKDAVKDLLFGGTQNANEAIKAMSYGHYGLVLGNGDGNPGDITVNVNLTASTTESSTMDLEMRNAATAMGYNMGDYDRVLIFCPQGTLNGGSSNWTAYAWLGHWRSVYSYGWTGTFFDALIHELGHNFGFHHSGKGTNEYGGDSCVMGYSHSSTGSTKESSPYSTPKLAQLNWMAPYSGIETSLTGDATLDLYPIAKDPNTTSGMRSVNFAGTEYFVEYRRNLLPYGKIWNSGDRDKVLVWTRESGVTWPRSTWQQAIASGGSYTAGNVVIKFESYGNGNKDFATVSFDLADGNAKPNANAQSATATINTAKAITLTGSDGDGDPLSYSVYSGPANGSLSGTAPNLTYTPNTNYLGSDSFVFRVDDGKISSFATVSITVDETNVAPVADNQSVSVFFNTPEFITLTGSDVNGDALTYSIVSGPGNGTLSGAAPNVTYTPGNSFSGSDSFTFKVNDGTVDSNTATVSLAVSITPNTAPTVDAGADQTIEIGGGPGAVPVAGADTFLDAGLDDGANATWEDSTGFWNLSINSGVTFVADAGSALPGITSAYSFPGGTSGAAGCDGTGLHDRGLDQQPMTLELWFKPAQSASYPSNGQVLYETGGGTGIGIFYNNGFVETAHDSNAGQISADVSSLTGEFVQIVVTYDTGSTTNNFNLYVNGQLQATGSRSDGDMCGGDGSGLGNRGEANTGGAGSGDSSTESFEGMIAICRVYHNQIVDAAGVLDNYNSIAGGGAAADLAGVVSDVDGQALATGWTQVSGPGSVTFADAASPVTTANFTETGTYLLRLTADDGYAQTFDEVTVTVTTEPEINNAPVANNGAVTTDQEAAVAITLTATDADADPLTYAIVSGPTNGTLSGAAPNLTYTPAPGFFGSDSFTFKANDGSIDSNVATVSIAVNQIPLRDADNPAGTVAGVAWERFLGNWSLLPDFDSLTADAIGTIGTFTIGLGEPADYFAYRYTGFVDVPADGIYTFYTASDDGSKLYIGTTEVVNNDSTHGVVEKSGTIGLKAGKHAITVTYFEKGGGQSLTVRWEGTGIAKATIPAAVLYQLPPDNYAPVANNGTVITNEDIAVAVTLTASDADGDALTYSVVSGPANGVLSGTAPNLTYSPNANFYGSDSFTFKANDGSVNSNTATVSITVNAVNDAPTWLVNPIVATDANQDQAYTDSIAGSATDLDGDALVYSKSNGPAWLTIGAAGLLTGTPAVGDFGLNVFTVDVNDGNGGSASASLEINVVFADSVAPTLTVPANALVSQLESTDPANTGEATATDDLDPNPVVTYTDSASGADPNPYIITRTWTATDSAGNATDAVQLITVYQVREQFAVSQSTTKGSVNGSLAATTASDDSYQSLSEAKSGRKSALDHEWVFSLGNTDYQTFIVEAFHSPNSEGDDFTFLYSTDGSTYYEMLTVTKTTDDGVAQAYELPEAVVGTVYVTVVDTNRANGNTGLDVLYIDYLGFRTEDWPAGSLPPGQASTPAPAHGAANVPADVFLSWIAGINATSANVYFSTTPPTASDLLTSTTGTSADPGTLAYSTTYYWRVDAVNDIGIATGPTWSFTTQSDPSVGPTDVHVHAIAVGTADAAKGQKRGMAQVTVRDDLGQPVAGATVFGTFTGSYNEAVSAVTDASGVAQLLTTATVKRSISFTFSVTNVTHGFLPYDPSDNVVTSQSF
jgi:hypothetical protein